MTFALDERYRVDDAASIDSPALLVFPEIIDSNIARAIALCRTAKGNCLRPHIKTVKCREIAKLAIDRGITRFKCSTVGEGELLAAAGATEVLLSYQLSGIKALRWEALRQRYPATRFASIVDNVDSARMLTTVMKGKPTEVYVDVNVGMDRTGIAPASAPTLVASLCELTGIVVRGLHVYDGHLHEPDEVARRAAAEKIYTEINELRNELERRHATTYELVMGGSPTFRYYAGRPNTTVSPGTFYLWDAGYGADYPELPFEPAALLLMRVLSIINERLICYDLGSKAVSPDKPLPRVVIPTLSEYTVKTHHEEHLTVAVPNSSVHKVGDVHYAIPLHVCPTVNLYGSLLPVTAGKVGDAWPVVGRHGSIQIK